MMMGLYFSCDFDVFVGGGEYIDYLLCHLDQKPPQPDIIKLMLK